jgi:hypothetical protein
VKGGFEPPVMSFSAVVRGWRNGHEHRLPLAVVPACGLPPLVRRRCPRVRLVAACSPRRRPPRELPARFAATSLVPRRCPLEVCRHQSGLLMHWRRCRDPTRELPARCPKRDPLVLLLARDLPMEATASGSMRLATWWRRRRRNEANAWRLPAARGPAARPWARGSASVVGMGLHA